MAHSFEVRNLGKAYDGDYPMPKRSTFTTLEWSWITKFSGYMPTTMDAGLDGFDPPLIVAIALVSMVREGKVHRSRVVEAWEKISDVAFDSADDEIPTVRFVVDPDAMPATTEEGGENPTTETIPPS